MEVLDVEAETVELGDVFEVLDELEEIIGEDDVVCALDNGGTESVAPTSKYFVSKTFY
jgi:hypothetical protein